MKTPYDRFEVQDTLWNPPKPEAPKVYSPEAVTLERAHQEYLKALDQEIDFN